MEKNENKSYMSSRTRAKGNLRSEEHQKHCDSNQIKEQRWTHYSAL